MQDPKPPVSRRQRVFRTLLQTAAGILLSGLLLTLTGVLHPPATGTVLLFLTAAAGFSAVIAALMNR